MDVLKMFRTAGLAGLGVCAAACQQQHTASLEPANAGAGAIAANVAAERSDAYIGVTFSEAQKVLASKPPDTDAPSF